jgi:hypothetical protein
MTIKESSSTWVIDLIGLLNVRQQHLACPVKPKILAKFGRLFSPKKQKTFTFT